MNILGILPARSGSKGLPNKNILDHGKPLLYWAARALLDSGVASMSICSTDCTKIATIAQEAGLSVPFLRPSSIAKDESTILSVIQPH